MLTVYSLLLIAAYAAAIRYTLVYIALMFGRIREFRKPDAWLHATAIAVVLNDFFDIFRW